MKSKIQLHKSVNEKIELDFNTSIELFIKREDHIHPYISGNKYRKLKYNLIEAKELEYNTLLTFGGAFSNHIAAVAAVGKKMCLNTVGIIRGEELERERVNNSTLKFANDCGMHFKFVSREDYRGKSSVGFIDRLRGEFGKFYLIPEGGTNELAIKGCEEILTEDDEDFDYICCCVGTGGTISGLINSSKKHQKIFGFPALKGNFLEDEICKFAKQDNWELITDYHFGGYAKITEALVEFINDFNEKFNIQLDPIYTAKMMFGIMDLIEKNYFPEESKILAIHSGGLQGIVGMNNMLKKKKLPLINYNEVD